MPSYSQHRFDSRNVSGSQSGQTQPVYTPDFFIPFALSADDACRCYEGYIASRQYLPSDFISSAKIVSVQEIFMPVWLFSGSVEFDFSWVDVETDFVTDVSLTFRRCGRAQFQFLPVCASKRIPDDIVEALQSYDFHQAFTYDPSYLEKFLTEPMISSDEAWKTAFKKLAQELEELVITREHNTFKRSMSPNLNEKGCQLAMLPIWQIELEYKGQRYIAGVNGQTGKVAMDIPVDTLKVKREVAPYWIPVVLSVLFPLVTAILFVVAYGNLSPIPREPNQAAASALIVFGPLGVIGFFAFVPLYYVARKLSDKRKAKIKAEMENVSSKTSVTFVDPASIWFSLNDVGVV